MSFIVQDRSSWQFLEVGPDGAPDWTPRVDRAARFFSREEAIFAGVDCCDIAGFVVAELADVRGPSSC